MGYYRITVRSSTRNSHLLVCIDLTIVIFDYYIGMGAGYKFPTGFPLGTVGFVVRTTQAGSRDPGSLMNIIAFLQKLSESIYDEYFNTF